MRVAMLGPYPRAEQCRGNPCGCPPTGVVGGPEAVILCLLKHLAQIGDLELHLITCRPEVTDSFTARVTVGDAQTGWTVHYLPRQRMGRFTLHLRERRRIVALLRQLRPDIVHAHMSGLYAAAALDSRRPALITVHGISAREAQTAPGWGERLRGALDGALEKSCLRRARQLIAISPYVEQEFAGITRAKTYAIENPVEDLFFQIACGVLHRQQKPGSPRILFAGRLIPRKGLLGLLSAFRTIADQYPQAELALAGEEEAGSPYVAALHQYVQEQGLERRVHFLGSLNMEQIAQEYRRSTFMVLPSRQETAPVVIEEAMAVGCPVIATRVGGVPYQIEHERSGLLVEYGGRTQGSPLQTADVAGLAAAMRRLLDDEALRERISQAARAEAWRRFRGEWVAQQTYQVYRKVVAEDG